jgi:flagellar biosynthesis/type III secretory pathway protein FliH
MPDRFVPLDEFFRRPAPDESAPAARTETPPAQAPAPERANEVAEALAAVRRFRAALADAVAAALDELLRDIACDVLARELTLAPADVAAIAAGALERYAADSPVSVRVHPDECSALSGLDLTAIGDPGLRRGDVVVDLHSGTIDASLGARLEYLLAAR